MSIKIDNNNYDTYKKVFSIICKHTFGQLQLPSEFNPLEILKNWELKSRSLANKGLQAGLNDSLTRVREFPKETYDNIDKELAIEQLPSLMELLGTIQKTINKVLKSKKINNLDQYYIIKEILDDTTFDITITDRENLSIYLMNFELKEK